jgi:hypothetical protein
MMKRHDSKPSRYAATLLIVLLLIVVPFSGMMAQYNTPGNLDPDATKLRMWLRADKKFTLDLDPAVTPSDPRGSGNNPQGTINKYEPFHGEFNPTGPHYMVKLWTDYAGSGGGRTVPAGQAYLNLNSVNPQTTVDGVAPHRGVWWEYAPAGHDDPIRNLVPVYLDEHPLTNYHPTVYFWYHSPDGNLRGNDEQGAFLSNRGSIMPFMNGNNNDPRPVNGEHTAFFLVNTSFPAQYKRVFFMGMNKKDQDCAGNGPSWGIFRIEKSGNADLGMSNGRFRAPSGALANTGYDNPNDPGLINKFATSIAGYQCYDETGSTSDFTNVSLDFYFNGSKLSTGNGLGSSPTEGHNWNTKPSMDATLGTAHDRFMGGLMSEVILYEKKISLAEIKKINSYLAFKYGITLSNKQDLTYDQGTSGGYVRGTALTGYNDYLLSDNTMVWPAFTSGGEYQMFYHNLSAVIHDNGSELLNYQSHSTDAGAIIRMGYIGGAAGDSNPGEADYLGPDMQPSDFGDLPDKKFVMWGHDASIYNNATYVIPNNICVDGSVMMNRVWMVRKTDGTMPYQMLISAQNNNSLFEDDAFPYGADTDVYLCIANSYSDARNGNFHTVIKSEYMNGEHQFNYTFSSEFTYFSLATVSTGISELCHGKQILPGAYMDFTTYTQGYAMPWQLPVAPAPNAHMHKTVGTIPATSTTPADNLRADVTTTYDSNVNRPSARFPRTKRGFLRVTRKGGVSNQNNNKVRVEIDTRSSSTPTTVVPTIPSFTISSINRRHGTNDEVTVWGECDGKEVKAKLSYLASASNSRYVIENGNHARTIRKGLAGRRNPKGQALATFNQAVSKVFVDYTTSLDLRRNHIDIFPVTFKPAPIPPPVNQYGMSFTKEAERYTVSVCDEVIYWLRLENYKPTTDVTVNISDVLPSGMIWSSTDVMFADTLNTGRLDRGQITVSKSGQNLTINGVIVPQKCDPATGGKVAVRITAMFDYTNLSGGFYNNQATVNPVSPGGIPSFTSVDAYTHDPYTIIEATAVSTRPAPVRHTFTTSREAYREKDEITLTWTIDNTNTLGLTGTAKSGCEMDIDFDAGFVYIGSYTGTGTPHWDATDSTLYIDGITIPANGTTTISFKLKAPTVAEYETDAYGAPIIVNGKPQKATLNIDYEFFGPDDPCEISAMDGMWGEKEIPYEAAPRYVVVNREINHSFLSPIDIGLYPGVPLIDSIAVCLNEVGNISLPIYSPAAGGDGPPYYYSWILSDCGNPVGTSEDGHEALAGLSTYTGVQSTGPMTVYLRRAVSDVSQSDAIDMPCTSTTRRVGEPIAITLLPTAASTTFPAPQTGSATNGVQFSYSPPTGMTYPWWRLKWTVKTPNPYVTGESSGSGTTMTGTLYNSSTSPQSVVYEVVPTNPYGGCPGAPFDVTITVSGATPIPLTDDYRIDGCVSVMYTYQTQELTVRDVSDPMEDDISEKNYQWQQRVYKNSSEVTSGWTDISGETSATYVIPVYRFNTSGTTPTVTTSDEVYVLYRCLIDNSVTGAPREAYFGSITSAGCKQMQFIHLGDYATIYAMAANNDGLIPVKLKTGPNVGDTIIIAHANLGAELDAMNGGITNDACDFGDLYQWGRETDGHEKIQWGKDGSGKIVYVDKSVSVDRDAGLSSSDYDPTSKQVLAVSPYSGNFIFDPEPTSPDFAQRWTDTQADMKDLWMADKPPADPCPMGWRVPTKEQWASLYGSVPETKVTPPSTPNLWTASPTFTDTIAGGYIVANTNANRIFLPAASVRNGQPLESQPEHAGGEMAPHAQAGLQGRYWTCSDEPSTKYTSGSNKDLLYAYSFVMGNGIQLNVHDWEGITGSPEGYPKLDGRSVRCVLGECVAPTTQPTIGSALAYYCEGGGPLNLIDVLGVVPSTPGNTLVWYDAATGGNVVNVTSVPIVTIGGLMTHYYYWITETRGACESSAARIPVEFRVTPRPVISGPASVKVGETITLHAVNLHAPNSYWSSDNTAIATVGTSPAEYCDITGVSPGQVKIRAAINENGSCGTEYWINVVPADEDPLSPLTIQCDSIIQFNNGTMIKQNVALSGQELYVKIYNPDAALAPGITLTATGGGMTFSNPSPVTLPSGYSWVRLVGSGTPNPGTKGQKISMSWSIIDANNSDRELAFSSGGVCGEVDVDGGYGVMSLMIADNNGAGTDNWAPGTSLATTRSLAILGGNTFWTSLNSPGSANFDISPEGVVDVNFKLYGTNHLFNWAVSVGGTFGTTTAGANTIHNAVNGLVGYDGEIPDIIIHAKENLGPNATSSDVVKLLAAYKKHVQQGGWLLYTTRAWGLGGNADNHTTLLLDGLGIPHGTVVRDNSTSFTINTSATGRAQDLLDGPFGDLSTGTHTIKVDNNNGSVCVPGLNSNASVIYSGSGGAIAFVYKDPSWKGGFICLGRNVDSNRTNISCGGLLGSGTACYSTSDYTPQNDNAILEMNALAYIVEQNRATDTNMSKPTAVNP